MLAPECRLCHTRHWGHQPHAFDAVRQVAKRTPAPTRYPVHLAHERTPGVSDAADPVGDAQLQAVTHAADPPVAHAAPAAAAARPARPAAMTPAQLQARWRQAHPDLHAAQERRRRARRGDLPGN